MKKALIGALGFGGALAIAAAGYWAGNRALPRTSAETMQPSKNAPRNGGNPGNTNGISVIAEKVAVTRLPQSIAAVGSLRSDEAVTVRPEVSGRIAEILFKEGQAVAKNTVLVQFDASIQRAELEQAKASYALNKSKLDRAIDLQQRGFISSQARDEADNLYRVSQAAVALAEAKLAKLALRAPFAGVVGLRSVSVGDYVKDGQDIVNLEAIDTLKADFRIPETHMSKIHAGQQLQITLDAIPGKTFNGQIYAINPLVDQNGRAIVIRATVRNNSRQLHPGMFARIRLLTQDNVNTLTIPEQALMPTGEDTFVFKIVDGKAQRFKVEVGQRHQARVEIIRGLTADEMVVVEGQFKLREGAVVRITEPHAEPPVAAITPQP